MSRIRLGAALVMGWTIVLASAGSVAAAPTVAQMLGYRPRLSGVDYSTPTAQEQAACTVKLVQGGVPGSSGWLLLDPQDRPLRKFFDANGDRKIDTYSYFKDGLEVYREIDSNANQRVDQYRWYNSGGMKWGIDQDEDGKIDSWRMISAHEVAEEAFHALRTRDFHRLQVLLISEGELKSLGLPEAYQQRIRKQLAGAKDRFDKVVATLKPVAEGGEVRVEPAVPQCVPAESIGVERDLFRFPTRTILYATEGNQFEMLYTGEMIKIGEAWRLLDVPAPEVRQATDEHLQEQMTELAKHDEQMPPPPTTPGPNPQVAAWNLRRALLIEKILPRLDAKRRAVWEEQLWENLAQAAIYAPPDDTQAIDRLKKYQQQVAQAEPGSPRAGFVTYRVLWADYARKIAGATGAKLNEYQNEWMKALANFVTQYPKAKDTPDALWQLAMAAEFAGKDEEARAYYKRMAEEFPQHPMTAKANGALRRLELVGKTLELSGKTLAGLDFDIQSLKGKVVIVYWWASYCSACAESFAKLEKLRETYGPKGLEIVTVGLDDTAQQAEAFLQKHRLTAHHLFVPGETGGMSSPLATQYGIMGLPTVFLVGKDGRVIHRNLPVNDLEDAVRKALE